MAVALRTRRGHTLLLMLHHRIALAGRCLQPGTVQHNNAAAAVPYHSQPLHVAHRLGHAFAAHAKFVCNQVLGDLHLIRMQPVRARQQQRTQLLPHSVMAVARRRLPGLSGGGARRGGAGAVPAGAVPCPEGRLPRGGGRLPQGHSPGPQERGGAQAAGGHRGAAEGAAQGGAGEVRRHVRPRARAERRRAAAAAAAGFGGGDDGGRGSGGAGATRRGGRRVDERSAVTGFHFS